MNISKINISKSVFYLGVLVVAGFILRIPMLMDSLWYDEIASTKVYLADLDSLIRCAFYREEHYPFFYTFMFFWVHIFGDHKEWIVRLPSLIAGLASIPLIFSITKKIFGGKEAFLSSFLFTISPVSIWYSSEARPYALPAVFFLLAIFSIPKIKQGNKTIFWTFIYFISLFFVTFSHIYSVVFLVGFIAISLLPNSKKSKHILIANGVLLFLAAQYLFIKVFWFGLIGGLTHLRPLNYSELWMLFFNWFSFGSSLWSVSLPWFPSPFNILGNPYTFLIVQSVYAAIFVLGIMSVIDDRNKSGSRGVEIIILLFCLPVFFYLLQFVGLKNTYVERACYSLLPLFYMIIAAGVFFLKDKKRLVALSFVITVSILSSFLFYQRKDSEWTVFKDRPDWRSAISYIYEKQKENDNQVALICSVPFAASAYYFKRLNTSYYLMPKNLKGIKNVKDKGIDGPWAMPLSKRDLPPYRHLKKLNIKKMYVIWVDNWRLYSPLHVDRAKRHPKFQFTDQANFDWLQVYEFDVK